MPLRRDLLQQFQHRESAVVSHLCALQRRSCDGPHRYAIDRLSRHVPAQSSPCSASSCRQQSAHRRTSRSCRGHASSLPQSAHPQKTSRCAAHSCAANCLPLVTQVRVRAMPEASLKPLIAVRRVNVLLHPLLAMLSERTCRNPRDWWSCVTSHPSPRPTSSRSASGLL
jgi:hypothetical protein